MAPARHSPPSIVGASLRAVGGWSSPSGSFFPTSGEGSPFPHGHLCLGSSQRIAMDTEFRMGKQPLWELGHVCGVSTRMGDSGGMGGAGGTLAVLGSSGVSECPGSF